jgi:hypothetical protein
MNVDFGNEAAQFHFGDYLFQIFGTMCLQCKYSNLQQIACLFVSKKNNVIFVRVALLSRV